MAAVVGAARTAAAVPSFFPVRLPGLPEAASWVSRCKLTPSAVAQARNGKIMTVKRSKEKHFMYTETGVPDRLPDDATGVGARTEFVDMAPADFGRACELQDGKTPPFHYYTCGVTQHAPTFAEQVVLPSVA